jgi:hypothetical protein
MDDVITLVHGSWLRIILPMSSLPLAALDVKLLNVKSIVFFFKRTRISRITRITMVSSFKIHVSSLAEMKENAKAIIPEPVF